MRRISSPIVTIDGEHLSRSAGWRAPSSHLKDISSFLALLTFAISVAVILALTFGPGMPR